MKHKVLNVEKLYIDSKSLLSNVNGGQEAGADTIMGNLLDGINNLKNNWEGADAGVQIQKVVVAYNAMVEIGIALANFSVSASKVATNYRNIQIINQANYDSFSVLQNASFHKLDDYSDNRDTININDDANFGKAKIDEANREISTFISNINILYNQIMDNWLIGTGRDAAQQTFDDFMNKANVYKENLSDVSNSITNALKNYTF